MFKIKSVIVLLFVVYILDQLYLLPLYLPLNTKPDTRRSATYLAKTIAKEAKCEDVWLLDINYEEGDSVLNFDCTFDTYLLFNIYVFLNHTVRDKTINNRNVNNPYHAPCFKKGPAYMICESMHVKHKNDRPIFYGKKYYSQFPGEEISFGKDIIFESDPTRLYNAVKNPIMP